MSRYRFCALCRGDDGPFTTCQECKQKFHHECLGLPLPVEEYICGDCEELEDDDDNDQSEHTIAAKQQQVLDSNEGAARSRIVNDLNKYHNRQMALYIEKSLNSFIRYSDKAALKKIIAAGKQEKSSAKLNDTISSNEDKFTSPSATPEFLTNATLKAYQVEGVSTLCSWYLRGIGGILADEMGLGKTIQTIAFIASCKHLLGVQGPHLVIVPLAVLQNWCNELRRFAPSITFKKLHGNMKGRQKIFGMHDVRAGKFDVYITTYDVLCIEEAFFTDSFPWASVIIDEGHVIKNGKTKLRKALNRLRSSFRLLLTGTPLQNNLAELGALLNFVLPQVFKDNTIFEQAVNFSSHVLDRSFCAGARDLLEQHMMLRRIKAEVETSLQPKVQVRISVTLSPLQRKWYDSIVSQDDIAISSLTLNQLKGRLSQLRKIVNHPKQIYNKRKELLDLAESNKYKYQGAEFSKPKVVEFSPEMSAELGSLQGESLIRSCGKLMMLDRLLVRLKSQGSRVLLFSQFTETLDVLEEYMAYRFGPKDSVYYRLDGSTERIHRELNVRSFNDPKNAQTAFIYLISTLAGGVGINLATADSVVLYDSSPNPQVDLQAQDRAHRIGQTKQVIVYRLITAQTFEERIMQTAARKMLLDKMVIANNEEMEDFDDSTFSIDEMCKLVFYGKEHRFKTQDQQKTDEELDLELSNLIEAAKQGKVVNEEELPPSPGLPGGLNNPLPPGLSQSKPENLASVNISPTLCMACNQDAGSSSLTSMLVLSSKNRFLAYLTLPRDLYLTHIQICVKCNAEAIKREKESQIIPENTSRVRKQVKRYDAPTWQQDSSSKKKPLMPRSSEDRCFVCRGSSTQASPFMCCSRCPKSYHTGCHPATRQNGSGIILCQWHSCLKCESKTSDTGSQLRCISCPSTYCFDCYPNLDVKQIQPDREARRWLLHGYIHSKSVIYIQCDNCSIASPYDIKMDLPSEQETMLENKLDSILKKVAIEAARQAELEALALQVKQNQPGDEDEIDEEACLPIDDKMRALKFKCAECHQNRAIYKSTYSTAGKLVQHCKELNEEFQTYLTHQPPPRAGTSNGTIPKIYVCLPCNSKLTKLADNAYEEVDITFCEICASGIDDASMLLCDGCDDGYHMGCLNPPLAKVPDDDWLCPLCIEGKKPVHEQRAIDGDSNRNAHKGSSRVWRYVCTLRNALSFVTHDTAPTEDWLCRLCHYRLKESVILSKASGKSLQSTILEHLQERHIDRFLKERTALEQSRAEAEKRKAIEDKLSHIAKVKSEKALKEKVGAEIRRNHTIAYALRSHFFVRNFLWCCSACEQAASGSEGKQQAISAGADSSSAGHSSSAFPCPIEGLDPRYLPAARYNESIPATRPGFYVPFTSDIAKAMDDHLVDCHSELANLIEANLPQYMNAALAEMEAISRGDKKRTLEIPVSVPIEMFHGSHKIRLPQHLGIHLNERAGDDPHQCGKYIKKLLKDDIGFSAGPVNACVSSLLENDLKKYRLEQRQQSMPITLPLPARPANASPVVAPIQPAARLPQSEFPEASSPKASQSTSPAKLQILQIRKGPTAALPAQSPSPQKVAVAAKPQPAMQTESQASGVKRKSQEINSPSLERPSKRETSSSLAVPPASSAAPLAAKTASLPTAIAPPLPLPLPPISNSPMKVRPIEIIEILDSD